MGESGGILVIHLFVLSFLIPKIDLKWDQNN